MAILIRPSKLKRGLYMRDVNRSPVSYPVQSVHKRYSPTQGSIWPSLPMIYVHIQQIAKMVMNTAERSPVIRVVV